MNDVNWTVGEIKKWLHKYNDDCQVIFHDRMGRETVQGSYLDVVIGVITTNGADEE